MKKKRLVILILLGVFAAAAVVALGLALNQKPTTTAVVLEVRTGLDGWHSLYFFTAPTGDDSGDLMTAALSPDTKLVGADGRAISAEDIRPGQLVELTHSGVVQTIYPSVYPDVYKVRVLGDTEAELYALAQARKEEWDTQFAQMAE